MSSGSSCQIKASLLQCGALLHGSDAHMATNPHFARLACPVLGRAKPFCDSLAGSRRSRLMLKRCCSTPWAMFAELAVPSGCICSLGRTFCPQVCLPWVSRFSGHQLAKYRCHLDTPVHVHVLPSNTITIVCATKAAQLH